MTRLSQETIAIIGVFVTLIAIIGVFVTLIGVSVALGALIVTTTGELRDEIQAVRAEGRADREALEKRMAQFEEHIIRLTRQQSALGGLVEGLRHRQPTTAGSNDAPG